MFSGISTTVTDGLTVITLTGELDVVAAPALRRALRPSADASLPDLLVDLGGVTFLDCAALGVLVRTSHAVQARGGQLQLRGLTGGPKRFFDLCHLAEVIGVDGPALPAVRVDGTAPAPGE